MLRTILRAITAVAASAGTMLIGRYLLGVGNLRRDARAVRWYLVEWSVGMPKLVSRLRLALWQLLGLTDARLWRLRDRYHAGEFGTEGT